jgi:hypothetical protein
VKEALWFRDRQAWRFIARRYLPWLAGLQLIWELAQLPLYTLWEEATPAYIAFAVAHCTLGDIVIGSAALLVALILLREGALPTWRWRALGVLTALIGAGYTVFSEWMNLTILRSWAYAESMPAIAVGAVEIGVSPLLQWLVLPPLSLYLSRTLGRTATEQAHQHHENGDEQGNHQHPAEQPDAHHPRHH